MRRLAVLIVVLFAGCSDDPIELEVDLRTDLIPGREFVSVETSLWDGVPEATPATALDDFLAGERVASFSGVSPGPMQIEVVLQNGEGTEVASRLVRFPIDDDLGILVVISRDCSAGRTRCASPQECVGGRCVDPECLVDEDECGTAVCSTDDQCAGVVNECTTARCATVACLAEPDDAHCAAGQRCDPDLGCVTEGVVDAGMDSSVPDAVVLDAGCVDDAGCPPQRVEPIGACDPVGTTCSGSGRQLLRVTDYRCVMGSCVGSESVSSEACTADPTGNPCGSISCGTCEGSTCVPVDGRPCSGGGMNGVCNALSCCFTCISGGSCHPSGQDVSACGAMGEPCRACTGGDRCAPLIVGGFCSP